MASQLALNIVSKIGGAIIDSVALSGLVLLLVIGIAVNNHLRGVADAKKNEGRNEGRSERWKAKRYGPKHRSNEGDVT